MKKSKILLVSLMALTTLAACGKSNSSSEASSSSQPFTSTPTSETSSNNTTTSSSTTPSSSSTTTTSEDIKIDHRQDFIVEDKDAFTRAYKSQFDEMINDFSSETLLGETTGKINPSHLKVLVDNETKSFPSNTDASIYKMASGIYEFATYDTINFRIKLVEGTIDYSNLVLALRGDDAYNVYEIKLNEALDDEGNKLPKLGSEYVDVKISIQNSIEDADTEYTLVDGGKPSGVKVLSKFIGFHLYAKGTCSAILDIEKVSLTKGAQETILDNFAREDVSKKDDTCWWRNSTGFIVQKGVTLNNNQTYKTPNIDLKDNTEIILNINGDTSKTKLSAIKEDGTKVTVDWKNLKDKDNKEVHNAINGAFLSLAINLENSGLKVDNLKAFEISSESEIVISKIFLSTLKEKEAATEYPALDLENAVYFDTFTRTQEHVDASYDVSAANQKIIDAGLFYSTTHGNGTELTSVDGDNLVLAPSSNYTQVVEGSQNGRTNQKYMVFSMKLEGEGDLSNFRVGNDKGIVYAPNWKAGVGLPSIPQDKENYPYVKDGYTLYIIDLETSGFSDIKDALQIYYTGTATLYIDSIFFADDYVPLENINGYIDTTANIQLAGYKYAGNVQTNDKTRYLELKLKGDGVSTFETFRFKTDGLHFVSSHNLVLKDGTEIKANDKLPEEETTYMIDLAASDIPVINGQLHLHIGSDKASDEGKGTVTFISMSVYNETYYSENTYIINSNEDMSKYKYIGGYKVKANAKYLKITIKGTTYKSIRMAYAGKLDVFLKDMIDIDGNVIGEKEIPNEGLTLTIDLKAS